MTMTSTNFVQYRVNHITRYDYESEVVQARHWLHLRPREHARQKVIRHGLLIDPAPTESAALLDAFGNDTFQMVVERPHSSLEVTADIEVSITPRMEMVASESLSWERARDELGYTGRPRSPGELEALSYRFESPQIKLKNVFGEFAAPCFGKGESLLNAAVNLMQKLFENLTYKPGATNTNTPLIEVLENRHGVCQDYAHLMIACLRSLGLSARYVSGYLRTSAVEPEEGKEPKKNLIGADASHAWVSVFIPPFGWIDLDPTNNVIVDTDHVTLGWGRDFSDVSPLRGVIVGGGQHQLSVGVSVTQVS